MTRRKWWVFNGASWVTLQTWSAGNSYVWQPARAGAYQVKVAVRSTSTLESADRYVSYTVH